MAATELQEMKADLEKLSAHLEEREQALDEREKALRLKGVSVEAGEKKKPLTKEQEKLIAEGCKAYGIDRKFLFSSGIDPHTGAAVLVTNGGAKVRFGKGAEVVPLGQVQVDGVSRKKPRHVMGKKK